MYCGCGPGLVNWNSSPGLINWNSVVVLVLVGSTGGRGKCCVACLAVLFIRSGTLLMKVVTLLTVMF